MPFGKKLIITSLSFILITTLQGITLARSVYVVSDTGTYAVDDSFIRSYEIDGNSLIYQQNEYKTVTQHAIGLAIDPCSEYIFVTCEDTPKIELINTKTMQYVDTVTAPGATNLAGVAMDTIMSYSATSLHILSVFIATPSGISTGT